jgi:hypothetical protein
MRVPHEEYLALRLEAHALLTDVPLRDVSAVDLPGGGDHRTIADVLSLMEDSRRRPSFPVRALVGLRRFIGKLLHWDGDPPEPSYAHRLSSDQRRRSLTPVGTASGPLRVLYEFPLEMVGEIENATVHAFACMALTRRPFGYRLYWAVYVRNVSRFTPFYMAAIEPFRRFVVYPAILGRIRDGWRER